MAKEYSEDLNKVLDKIISCDSTKESLEKALHVILAGANPNYRKDYGNTILMKAVQVNDFEMVKALVKAGCDVNVERIDKFKPVDMAINNLSYEMVEWFFNNGNDIHELVKRYNKTFKRIHFLCSIAALKSIDKHIQAIKIAKLMIEKGADLLEVDSEGLLPAEIAKTNIANDFEKTNLPFYKFIKKESAWAQAQLSKNDKDLIPKLQNENIELKADNEKLEDLKNAYKNQIETLQKETTDLKKENGRLEQLLVSYTKELELQKVVNSELDKKLQDIKKILV